MYSTERESWSIILESLCYTRVGIIFKRGHINNAKVKTASYRIMSLKLEIKGVVLNAVLFSAKSQKQLLQSILYCTVKKV